MSNPKELRNRLGNPVSGAEFWPRADVVDHLVSDLLEGKGSRRLFALRRIGKTSVLLELERRLKATPGLTVIRIDVQGISRFRDFLSDLFAQIPTEDRLQNARGRIANNPVLQNIMSAVFKRVAGTQAESTPSSFQNEFDHNAAWAGDIEAMLEEAGPIVLIVDELPYMLRNMMRDGYKPWDVERFLATLRNWRMNSGVRMLLSGSVGLSQLSRTENIHVADHIGDLFPVQLPPLARDDAIEMVEALARGRLAESWTRSVSEAIVDASAETWPIFLQYAFDAIVKAKVRDPASIRATIDANVRHALDENFYSQFSTRLSRYQSDEKAARVLLKTVISAHENQVAFEVIDAALAKIDATARRDDLLEALREDDLILFDTEMQVVRAASKLVPIWVRARPWGR